MNKVKAIRVNDIKQVSSSIVRPANTTAYTIGDVLSSTTNTHFTFSDAVVGGNSGEVISAGILVDSYVATAPDIDLFLFATDVANVADNAAAAFSDAEMGTCIGVISFPAASWKGGNLTAGAGGNQVHFVTLNRPIKSRGAIYAQAVMRNAYIPVASETYTVTLHIRQD